ncbi:DUF3043 domain-containing protein [Curtobacterium sp. S6]|uniref:DUF3043 domain-containing protein n=2 Tax=Micrococcales TaxID=85006 RepID=UPI0004AA7540|nr:DUF3043 domain-containing protein [Curtobacterium sp. S6]
MFGSKKKTPNDNATGESSSQPMNDASAHTSQGKGRPTPTRKEREQARKRPLVPDDRKVAKEKQREAAREARLRQNQAMQTGDDRYLPVKDRGPQRRFLRDYVDARFNIGDYFIVILLVIFILGLLMPLHIQQYTIWVMWIFIAIWVLDFFILWRKLKRAVVEKFGSAEPGSGMYVFNRVMMIRKLRMPKPQVKRGDYPS